MFGSVKVWRAINQGLTVIYICQCFIIYIQFNAYIYIYNYSYIYSLYDIHKFYDFFSLYMTKVINWIFMTKVINWIILIYFIYLYI